MGSYLFTDELGEDQGKNGYGDDHGNANGESHEAPFLGPPPPPPPSSPMTKVGNG